MEVEEDEAQGEDGRKGIARTRHGHPIAPTYVGKIG